MPQLNSVINLIKYRLQSTIQDSESCDSTNVLNVLKEFLLPIQKPSEDMSSKLIKYLIKRKITLILPAKRNLTIYNCMNMTPPP